MYKKANLKEKTERYKNMLNLALNESNICIHKKTHLFNLALEFKEMANSYYYDGTYFMNQIDYVNALASFSYGYGWLDAGIRLGIFEFNEKKSYLFSF